jgi:hypothetical protein
MVAMTMAAIPTPTEVPSTPLPSPSPPASPTPLAPPTLAFQAPTVAPTQSGVDDCNHLFDLGATGNARAKVLINNNNKGPVNLSLGMGVKNAFGQCGYLAWSIPAKSSITVDVPQTGKGPCWYGYAWVNGKDPSTPQGGPFCFDSPLKWVLDIGGDSIGLTPP